MDETVEPQPSTQEALEAKIAATLSSAFGEPVEDAPVDDAPEAESEAPEGESQTTDYEESEESAPHQEAAASSAPTLPDAHARSLKAYGWTDEDIEKALKSDSSAFIATAARIHRNRNDEVAAYAQRGRAIRQQEQNQTPDPIRPNFNQDGTVKPLDRERLIEQYGNEDLVDEVLRTLNPIMEQFNSMKPQLENFQKSQQEAQQAALARRIDEFFQSPSLAVYSEAYGKSFQELTEEQAERRNKVLEMADAIMVGATAQGRQLDVSDALLMAHDSVSGEFKKTAIRKEITNAVKQRSRSRVMRPSHMGSGSNVAPRNREEAEARIASKLRTVFG